MVDHDEVKLPEFKDRKLYLNKSLKIIIMIEIQKQNPQTRAG